jgi:hypothetical protein
MEACLEALLEMIFCTKPPNFGVEAHMEAPAGDALREVRDHYSFSLQLLHERSCKIGHLGCGLMVVKQCVWLCAHIRVESWLLFFVMVKQPKWHGKVPAGRLNKSFVGSMAAIVGASMCACTCSSICTQATSMVIE